MLALRNPRTYCSARAFGLLLGIYGAALADSGRLGPGDVRDGYESSAYHSRSAMLQPTNGKRLPLARLAASPPLGLPRFTGTLDAAAVDLGRRLFFDRRLSVNATLSCAMCHIPEQGFTQNEMATPLGVGGLAGRRNAPSLYNVAFVPALFHDGREARLTEQIWSPLLAVNEMGNASRAAVLARIAGLDDYAEKFAVRYADGLTQETLGLALASYQQGLMSAASPFDEWYFNGNGASLDASARRGFELFSASGCIGCHTIDRRHALFTDGAYHDTGIGYRASTRPLTPARVQLAPGVFVTPAVRLDVARIVDEGRFEVTGLERDRRRFRTPTLRNVALTAPYMHDGSLASLAAVIDYYDSGGAGAPGQDARIRPLHLGPDGKQALLAFLRALTGSNVEALAADARSVPIGDAAGAQTQ